MSGLWDKLSNSVKGAVIFGPENYENNKNDANKAIASGTAKDVDAAYGQTNNFREVPAKVEENKMIAELQKMQASMRSNIEKESTRLFGEKNEANHLAHATEIAKVFADLKIDWNSTNKIGAPSVASSVEKNMEKFEAKLNPVVEV